MDVQAAGIEKEELVVSNSGIEERVLMR